MTAIETDGLTRRYGDLVAVDGVDLCVREGEVFGFLGPNGAGKSTTINVLLGFLRPTAGRVTVLGHDPVAESLAVRERTGLLPEGMALYGNLTGREHLASAVEATGASDDPADLLERVGLSPAAADRRVGGYSKGMTQRLSLALALVGSPDLLVLDEPSSGLDPAGAKLLRSIVREEADRGATVFLSSHVLGQVERVCDRVGIMHEGRLAAVDTIDALREAAGTGAVVTATVETVPDLDPVADLEGVREVSVSGDEVEIACAGPHAKMPALRALDDRTTVTDLDVADTSLEALFERYTGKASADAAAGEGETAATGGDAVTEDATGDATEGAAVEV
ncbi:MAG: ABC transporter ATP-binding protein [Halobacteriaceae archaeon]